MRALESVSAPVVETWPDAELIDRARGGNALAFAVLYDRYADRVYRHIAYRVDERADCEDLTQQTFLKAWQAIGRYQITEVPFVGWLLTIAHNVVVSHFRSARPQAPLAEGLAKADERADAVRAVERREAQEAVRSALGKLKPEFQQVVAMRYLEELDYAEIARLTGKREGTVRVTLHRALQQLRKHVPRELS